MLEEWTECTLCGLGVREDDPTHHMLMRSRPMFQDLWRRKQIISLTFD